VVVDIKQYKSQFKNSNFPITQSARGLGYTGGSNFGFSHWNGWSFLQQCCATAQPVIIYVLPANLLSVLLLRSYWCSNVFEWEMSIPPTPQLGHGSLYLF